MYFSLAEKMDKTNDKPIRATCSLSDLRISFFVFVKFPTERIRSKNLLYTISKTSKLIAKKIGYKPIKFCLKKTQVEITTSKNSI